MKKIFFIVLTLFCSYAKSHQPNNANQSANSIAQLGVIFYNNNDIPSALEWLQIAYEKQQLWVGYYLSEIYISKKDYNKAINYILQGAKNNCPRSQLKLGQMFVQGNILTKDITTGLWWITQSADLGYNPARLELAQYYYQQEMYTEAINYILKAAENGCAKSQFQLFQWIIKGKGLNKDMTRAMWWLTNSANQGYKEAQSELGTYFYNNRDLNQAKKWLTESLNFKLIKPEYIMSKIYFSQKKYTQSISFLIEILKSTDNPIWLKKVKDRLKSLDKIESLESNKKLYFAWGLFFAKKYAYKKACYWLQKASELDCNQARQELKQLAKCKMPEALFALGKIYIDKEPIAALKYFKTAAENNFDAAKFYVTKLNQQQLS